MKYDELLTFTARCGYISAQTAALRFASDFTERDVQLAYYRVKKQLTKAIEKGHLKKYTKDKGLAIFALTRSGAAHLHGQGFEVKSTVKTAYDSKHVYHRLVADGFCLALRLLATKSALDAGLKPMCWYERDCLKRSDTFNSHFQKVPDSAYLIDKNMTWIEVDTARKKATDMARLLKFIKFGMCLDENSLAVHYLGNPQATLWICSGPAFVNARNKLGSSFSEIRVKKLDVGGVLTIDSGAIQRPVIFISFDFSSIADLHTRLVTMYKEAIEESLPCSL